MQIAITIDGKEEGSEEYPYFLKEINGMCTILEEVIKSLKLENHDVIFIMNSYLEERYSLSLILKQLVSESQIVIYDGHTKGALCTFLLGIDKFNLKESVAICAIDQILKFDIVDFFTDSKNNYDASTVTFESIHPKWSHVNIRDGLVVEASGKQTISNIASTGVYFFNQCDELVEYAKKFILKYNNLDDYYVNYVLNEYILENKRVGNYRINSNDIVFYKKPTL
jgi:hypothetical protein